MQSAAIVTTIKHQGASLETFVRYHLSIGFGRIYLMFDDPSDRDQERISGYPEVKAIPVDQTIRDKWQTFHQYPRYDGHTEREVRARQALNAEMAMGMALEEGYDWLLHIDGDELFWPGEPSISKHLESLASEGLDVVKYFNQEGVPTLENIDDYFLQVKHFKKPRKLLAKQGINVKEIWQEPARYFNFYTNGKSMSRVRQDMVPNDVHEWRSKTGPVKSARFYYPAILHYSCCGYQFFKAKFQKHMDYNSDGTRFGITLRDRGFHLDYDALMAYKSGNETEARRLYRQHMMLSEESLERYKSAGLIQTVDVPGRIHR